MCIRSFAPFTDSLSLTRTLAGIGIYHDHPSPSHPGSTIPHDGVIGVYVCINARCERVVIINPRDRAPRRDIGSSVTVLFLCFTIVEAGQRNQDPGQ